MNIEKIDNAIVDGQTEEAQRLIDELHKNEADMLVYYQSRLDDLQAFADRLCDNLEGKRSDLKDTKKNIYACMMLTRGQVAILKEIIADLKEVL